MSQVWTVILEILKISIPPIAVGVTVFYVLRELLKKQTHSQLLDGQQLRQQTSLPLRLQAYERLSVFCERISIPNLVLRLRNDAMTSEELKLAMLLAIRQEYEHNISQQVYVSENLWKIIILARDDVSTVITEICNQLTPNDPALELSRRLFIYLQESQETALDKALMAIKREAGTLF